MADITVTKGLVRPLDGAVVRQYEAAAAIDLGMAVTLNVSGTIQKTASASVDVIGILVSGSNKGTTVAAGEICGVVVFGPVAGFSGMTPSGLAYLDSTAGGLDTAGSVPVGYAENAEVLFVMPALTNAGS